MRVLRPALTAVILAAGSLLIPPTSVQAAPHPVAPRVTDVAIPSVAPGAKRAGPSATAPVRAQLARSGVSFDLVGVSFDGPAPSDLTIEARVRSTGTWSDWHELALGDDEGPDARSSEGKHATAGTQPLLAARSDAVQVRVSTSARSLPKDLHASLVDAGSSPADVGLAMAPAAAAGIQNPGVITRAQWGADERLEGCTHPRLSGYKGGVVHHTVNANSYSASQAPALIRSIYAYHTKTRHWCDIGYNFLVDRFGRVYEGRKGSITGFVQGAQAGGFNTETFGVSVIGDFTSVPFPYAVQSALARTIAWQADRSNFDPGTSVTLTSDGNLKFPWGTRVVRPRVMGHRDLSLTECPGNRAYRQLPAIRTNAVSIWNVAHTAAPSSRFTATTPRRVLDTRSGLGTPRGRVGGGKTVTLRVPGLPRDATAVLLTVTGVKPSGSTYLSVYPGYRSRMTTSNVSLTTGRTIAGLVPVAVRSDGAVKIYNARGSIDVLADLVGYYRSSTGSRETAAGPKRVLDTRSGLGARRGKVPAGRTLTATVPGLPRGTTSVTVNLTVVGADRGGHITAYGYGARRPSTSNVNFVRGETMANAVTVRVGSGNRISLYSSNANVHLVADLMAYQGSSGTDVQHVTVQRRVMDTRTGLSVRPGRLAAGHAITLPIGGLPKSARSVTLAVTATSATGSTVLTTYPGRASRPHTSTLNVLSGRSVANLVTVPLGSGDTVTFYSSRASTHLVADLIAYDTR